MDGTGPVNSVDDPITARLKAIKAKQQTDQASAPVDAMNPFSGNIAEKKKRKPFLQRLLTSLNNLFNPNKAIQA